LRAVWRGEVVAESERTLEVGGYRYFPRESVRMDWLLASPKTESDLACPHGVQFYDLVAGTERSERAAWSYEAPRGSMQSVERWIGFWEDVVLE
jgi:uncharacterized protein (DUF427 family)